MSEGRIHRKLQKAARLLQKGQPRECIDLCRWVTETEPNNVHAYLLQSKAWQQTQNFDAMVASAKSATLARPKNVDARIRLAETLLLNGATRESLDVIRDIETRAGDRTGALKRAAEFYRHCGQHEAAYRCQLKAAQINADDPETIFGLADSSQAIGELAQSEKLYNRLIYLKPEDHDAWYHRSALRRQTLEDNHLHELSFVFDELPENHPGRVPIAYALAKEWDDLDHYDESFHFLQLGAAARDSRFDYDVAQDEHVLRAIAELQTPDWLAASAPGYEDDAPIFVLGLPGSGFRLVEGILSAHSQVASRGDTNIMAMTLNRLGGLHKDRVELLKASSNIDPAILGAAYFNSLDGFGDPAPQVLDATPLNFLYLGLIRRALPKAKVIHLRRFAMDSCYTLYKTLFRKGYPFSYGLEDVAQYYMAYHDLMAHWRKAMPGFFLDVDYEKLVDQGDDEVRRLLEFLELPAEPGCLGPAQRKVSSVNRWKSYRRQLGPLAVQLKAHGIAAD